MKENLTVKHGKQSMVIAMDLDASFLADLNTKKYNTMYGSAEPEVVSVMNQVLKPGDCAIDGGANVGYFALIMAKMVGESGSVLAFEPGPNNLPKLKANIGLNKADQVTVSSLPLWSKHEEVTLHMAVDSGMHSLRPHNTFGTQVMESTTIDAWHVRPKLIKLDIEGSEIDALVGGVDTITACKPYIVCELNKYSLECFGKTPEDLRAYARNTFGYETFALVASLSYPVFVPPSVEIVTPFQNTNVLFATFEMVAKVFPEIHYG